MERPDLAPQLKALPAKPGVYRFFDDQGEILYVGKAGSLRNRVRSYFHKSAGHAPKVRRLVEKVATLDWIVTQSDLEALLLEMNLIKEHRPHYNVLLKDDKRYPYIKVTWADPFPKVHATRKVVRDGSRYYGPYSSAAAMYETLNTLRKVFPYLDCNRVITGQDPRACLYHDLGLCLAPCIGAATQDEYRAMIEGLGRFLEGDTGPVMADLKRQMAAHAERLEFEQAAKVRDRILAIQAVVERQRIIAPSLSDQDVIALARADGSALAQVFFVRNGKLIGREYFQLDGTEDETDAEVVASFIKQFYDDTALVPGEIVVPDHIAESQIIEQWLRDKRGTRVKVTVPRRGHKRDLVSVAVENAAETLRALKAAHAAETQDDTARLALEELQAALDLPRLPERIECYDISNLQGTHTVGAMVVFAAAAPCRADYRHFRIRTVPGQDDFASMGEMLSRRFQRLARARAEAGEPRQRWGWLAGRRRRPARLRPAGRPRRPTKWGPAGREHPRRRCPSRQRRRRRTGPWRQRPPRLQRRTHRPPAPSSGHRTWCSSTAAGASWRWRWRCCKAWGWTTSRWPPWPSATRSCSCPAARPASTCPGTARRCSWYNGCGTRRTASPSPTTASCARSPACAPHWTRFPASGPAAAGRCWCTSARWTVCGPPAWTPWRRCRA